ncbi:MAG: ferrochelatase [Pseudomonadota bacterium]
MAYIGTKDFDHDGFTPRIGVLLTNLGTPAAPTKAALRPYLKQFLSDPRVVEIPRVLWWLILNGIILNVRPAKSAKAYEEVWTEEGSPLLINTRLQAEATQARLSSLYGDRVLVDFAMRYGEPSIDAGIQRLLDRGARQLLVIPLFPQYAAPTTASTFDAVSEAFKQRRWLPDLRIVSHYHDHHAYIAALGASILSHWQSHGRADKLLLSYHGAPKRYLEAGDPYYCECHKTTRLLAEMLGLGEEDYLVCFQSRFGNEEWLKPYTDETLSELPAQGVKSVQVICPGFSSDCLETIEEIAMENRDYFLEAGGERYEYIPCLNDSAAHIEMLTELVRDNAAGWLPDIAEIDVHETTTDLLAAGINA